MDRFIDRYSDNPHALAFTDGGDSIRAIAREAAARIVPTMAREATRRKSAHELVKTIHRGFGRRLGELPQFRQRPLPIEFKHAMNHARDRLALHAAATADATALQAYALRFLGEDASGTPPPAPEEFFARSSAVAAAARDGLLPTIVLARAMRAWARVRAATAGGLIADEADVAAVHEALEASSSEGGLHEETVRMLEEAEALFRQTIAIETNAGGGTGDDVEDEDPEVEVEVDEEQDEEQDEDHDATPDLSDDAAIEFEAVKDDWLARLPKTKAAKLLEAIDACADDLEVMEAVAASAEEDATKVRAGARARVLEATAKLSSRTVPVPIGWLPLQFLLLATRSWSSIIAAVVEALDAVYLLPRHLLHRRVHRLVLLLSLLPDRPRVPRHLRQLRQRSLVSGRLDCRHRRRGLAQVNLEHVRVHLERLKRLGYLAEPVENLSRFFCALLFSRGHLLGQLRFSPRHPFFSLHRPLLRVGELLAPELLLGSRLGRPVRGCRGCRSGEHDSAFPRRP